MVSKVITLIYDWVYIYMYVYIYIYICLQQRHYALSFYVIATKIKCSPTLMRSYRGQGSRRHDDVIKWKHFPRYWPFVWGIRRSPVNTLHKVQWCGSSTKNNNPLFVTHLLKLLDKVYKYEMDPVSIVEDTERRPFSPQTDRRTRWNQYTPPPPFNYIEQGV